MSACIVLCTIGSSQKAQSLSETLVKLKLCACVNIISTMTSVYEWQGQVQTENECLLMIKTQKDKFEALKNKILSLHEYQIPEVIQLDITDGHQPYLDWIKQCTHT